MAIYHCSVKTISRGAGQSIVAAAAYRHACKLEDNRTGEVHDYSRKRGLEYSSIYLPSGVNASWGRDRERLWNAAESAEKRKDSRLGREIVFALPCELSKEQRRELVGEMADYLAKRYGLAVDVAIHEPSRKGDQRNYHVHMLLSSRRITSEGFKEKARELDDHEQGPKEIEVIRGKWASLANQALDFTIARNGIDHRSLKAQGIRRAPTVHLGPSATAMERRGIRTRLGDRNREAAKLNEQVAGLELEQKLQVEALKKQQNEENARRENINERLANIIARRAVDRTTGEDTEGKRTVRGRTVNERLSTLGSPATRGGVEAEQSRVADESVNDFIRELETKTRASEKNRDNSVTQSMDREAARERHRIERERRSKEAGLGY